MELEERLVRLALAAIVAIGFVAPLLVVLLESVGFPESVATLLGLLGAVLLFVYILRNMRRVER